MGFDAFTLEMKLTMTSGTITLTAAGVSENGAVDMTLDVVNESGADSLGPCTGGG